MNDPKGGVRGRRKMRLGETCLNAPASSTTMSTVTDL